MINFCPDFCRNCPLLLPKLSGLLPKLSGLLPKLRRHFLILRPNIFDSSAEFWHFDSSAEESKFYKIGLDTAEDEPLCFLAGSF